MDSMVKYSTKIIFYNFLFAIYFAIAISIPCANAVVLNWNSVVSTSFYEISGYEVHYRTSTDHSAFVINVGNSTSYDLDLLDLDSNSVYYFSVCAYTTANQKGPLSTPISYPDRPFIVEYPVINYNNNYIDVTFSKDNMQGVESQNNYEFTSGVLFDSTRPIIQSGRIFRLFMTNIPKNTLITMTTRNIRDEQGNALISNSITLNDADNDLMADDWEAHYGIRSAFLDYDRDGLYNLLEFTKGTDPLDNDTDNDGMTDGWENENGLNPLLDDSNDDTDQDGITNLVEYAEGTDSTNRGPEIPIAHLPLNSSNNVSLSPQLIVNDFVDFENDTHLMTQWQISTEQLFTNPDNIIYNLESYDHLTILKIPEYILEAANTYFWRVRFYDIYNGRSLWSSPHSFSTIAFNPEDIDNDGVPDNQELENGVIDLNNDGTLDVLSNKYKLISNGDVSFGIEGSNNVSSVKCLKIVDPNSISDTYGKPSRLDFGLIQFKLTVANPGDIAEAKIYFSKPANPVWYKYDLINGWREYSRDFPNYVQFSLDRKSITLRIVDGGPGDADGVINGVIVDPSGPGRSGLGLGSSGGSNGSDVSFLGNSDDSNGSNLGLGNSGDSNGSGGGGCFIATAAFGSPIERHVQILKEFRDVYLLNSNLGRSFVNAYYKYSPPIAAIITRNDVLKSMTRIGLIPLVGFSYLAIHTSFWQKSICFCLLMSMILVVINKRKVYS